MHTGWKDARITFSHFHSFLLHSQLGLTKEDCDIFVYVSFGATRELVFSQKVCSQNEIRHTNVYFPQANNSAFRSGGNVGVRWRQVDAGAEHSGKQKGHINISLCGRALASVTGH